MTPYSVRNFNGFGAKTLPEPLLSPWLEPQSNGTWIKVQNFSLYKIVRKWPIKISPFCSGSNMMRWSYFCHLRRVVSTVNLPHLSKPMIKSCVVSLCNSVIINLNIKIFRGQNNLDKGTYSWVFFVVYSFNYLFGVEMLRRAFYVLPPTCYAKSLTHPRPLNQRRVIVNWDPRTKFQWNIYSKIQNLSFTKSTWRYRSWHGGHFVQREMSQSGNASRCSGCLQYKNCFQEITLSGGTPNRGSVAGNDYLMRQWFQSSESRQKNFHGS